MQYSRTLLVLAGIMFLQAAPSFAQFQPNTTLTAEKSSNTSAAGSFITQSNGNIAAGSVSKVPTRTLLYPGATARLFAHFMPWFGGPEHMNVGYVSGDTLQIQKQVNDMIGRGLDGAVIDWYGPGISSVKFAAYDRATQSFMHEAEQHSGFVFAVMMDFSALQSCSSTAGCDVTQALVDNLNYANTTYFTSPGYLQYNGRPVLYFFGQESYTVDWNRVRSSVAGNPLFVFRNAGGFSYVQSDGGFAWAAVSAASVSDPMALGYLDNFYSTAISNASDFSTGAGYKGFDDSLASWGTGRHMAQQCGQTWLKSMAEAGKYYSPTQQMFGIQLVSWNDYEEGTEIETGIDNCVSVSASAAGTTVNWSISGDPATLDHFQVFLSQDGENLMALPQVPVTASSLDVARYSLQPGDYTAYVEAVGKPSIVNQFSPPTILSIATPAPSPTPIPSPTPTPTPSPSPTPTPQPTPTPTPSNQPPHAVLSVSTGSILVGASVTANTSASSDPDGTIASRTINFGDGTVSTSAIAAHQYKTAGTYTILATVRDNRGATASASAPVIVKAQYVTITSPAGDTVTGTSTKISGTGFSGYRITKMAIYVDSSQKVTSTASSISGNVTLSVGKHVITVQAWDSSGVSFKAQKAISRTK